jgi:hypothetical protein
MMVRCEGGYDRNSICQCRKVDHIDLKNKGKIVRIQDDLFPEAAMVSSGT